MSNDKTANTSNRKQTMLAFVVANAGDTEGRVVEHPKPQPEMPNFALIRVLRAGVCNTDLEILKGYMGFTGVLGHEFVGVVEEFHEETDPNLQKEWLGQRVCGDINVGCDNCAVCHNTHNLDACCSKMSRNHCPNRSTLGIMARDGTMAEYLTLPIRNLHKVPPHVSDEEAVFAEPLAAACRILEQGLIQYGIGKNEKELPDKVAILGDGKLGLMIAEVLGRAHLRHYKDWDDNQPPPPILFGKHTHKLQLVANSGVVGKLVSECMDESAFSGVAADYAAQFDVVVDATGSPAGLKLAAGLCRPMGTLVLKSTCAAGEQFNAAPFVIDELKVVGSRCGPINEALELLALSQDKDTTDSIFPLGVEKYITKTFPLSQAAQAIQCAAEKSTMKVQIICNES